MLTVETEVTPSRIEDAGLGLFALTVIKAGEVVWRYQEGFDHLLKLEDFATLPEVAQNDVLHHQFFSEIMQGYVLMPDNAVFFNHADDPNTISVPDDHGHPEPMTVAARDIQPGEELTCNYYEFDAQVAKKFLKNS